MGAARQENTENPRGRQEGGMGYLRRLLQARDPRNICQRAGSLRYRRMGSPGQHAHPHIYQTLTGTGELIGARFTAKLPLPLPLILILALTINLFLILILTLTVDVSPVIPVLLWTSTTQP